MTHLFYTLAIIALLPWALLHLLWRARRQPAYLRHWGERFGRYDAVVPTPTIWIHAVSVGETRAAQPLIAALKAHYPHYRILLTHMTPTGRATSEDLFGDTIERVYLPYDTPWGVRRFLRHFQPSIGLIMETELWPNLVATCRTQQLPLLLVNARLSARSARRYGRFPNLTHSALTQLAAISAIGEEDAARLRALGAPEVSVFGSVKFDITPPPEQLTLGRALRQRIGDRPVFLCASTREGEEALILDAWQKVGVGGMALLAIVPRHPQRFDEVAGLIAARGLTLQRRSDEKALAADTQVWLGDSMGEMFAYHAAADVVFVGGSLLDFGCQNLIEPCAVGTPVLIGPSTFNFADAARGAIKAGAAIQVGNAAELVTQARALLADDTQKNTMASAGRHFASRHRGATERTMALIEGFIPAAR
ncbi:MAG: lipid IV(A) 3-deoxy-D-manno-octulosonic acid transferase [Rhodocyclaceae bacterium]|nr:lipid IV(A) 3-deoxy-D-manno-octulosonic acid transferase [Rhodocyclaceae bacterium]MDZ4215953.1 lipid IV(A) 3-deoxy-D-manno-octulosonic acid transferase [Rhodocyclaceae bacterium]